LRLPVTELSPVPKCSLTVRNSASLLSVSKVMLPMSARVIQRMGKQYDPNNFLLMHAVGANVAGQIGSVLAGGILLAWLG
ncbi:MAG: sodium ion-translocating decarboxylase subunit beta, partial [Thermovirgaceae bacterium]|nr:sodium ion-translocating decarboxylase subunit beta [Thermovirgaceae bacterium]